MSTIKLVQFPKAPDLPSFSPFCAKVELFCKVHNIPYENQYESSPRKAPKGKFPAIIDGQKQIADSDLILDYLIQKHNIPDQYGKTEEEMAKLHALEVMLNEHFYWAGIYSRWVEPKGFQTTSSVMLKKLPAPLRFLVGKMIRKNMLKQINNHGLGRHEESVIFAKAMKDLKAVKAMLAGKTYLGGDKMCKADFTAYAFLYGALSPLYPSPMLDYARAQKEIVEYVNRISGAYFPKTKPF